MHNLRWFPFAILSAPLVLASAGAARATPLQPNEVAPDAKWVVHIDFDAARSAATTRSAATALLSWEPVAKGLEITRLKLGLDPTIDLRAVTLFGNDYAANAIAMIVRAKLDRPRLETYFAQLPGHTRHTAGNDAIHTWRLDARGAHLSLAAAAFAGSDRLVLAHSRAVLERTLARFAQETKPGGDSALSVESPLGAVLLISASELNRAELPFRSPLVCRARSLWIAVGEHQGLAFLRARVTAESEAVAGQLRALVDGLRASLQLEHGDDTELREAVASFRVSQQAQTLQTEWRLPVQAALKLIEKGWGPRQAAKHSR